jgi:hypothetical protein
VGGSESRRRRRGHEAGRVLTGDGGATDPAGDDRGRPEMAGGACMSTLQRSPPGDIVTPVHGRPDIEETGR